MPGSLTQYDIACWCGKRLHGARTARSRAIRCPACERDLFVLGQSSLPPAWLGAPETTDREAPADTSLRFWLGPAAAALAALVVVSLIVAAMIGDRRGEPRPPAVPRSPSDLWESAQTAIAEGAYRLASHRLNELAERYSGRRLRDLPVSSSEFRSLRRQVELLADLTPESVEEIMRHSIGQSDAEWQAVFADRYRNRGVILDARLFRDSAGRFHIDYQLESGGLNGEWDLQNLTLLRRLPLQQPQRVFLGVRLADVSRTSRDRWVVRPAPDSGVVFTDPALLAGLSTAVDFELASIIRRQAAWGANE